MTRELAKWLLEHPDIHKAYAEGKMIQILQNGVWVDLEDPTFNSAVKYPNDYRVKPSSKYRPYTKEELPALVGKTLHHKSGLVEIVVAVTEYEVAVGREGWYSPKLLLESYTIDGHPAGVEQ